MTEPTRRRRSKVTTSGVWSAGNCVHVSPIDGSAPSLEMAGRGVRRQAVVSTSELAIAGLSLGPCVRGEQLEPLQSSIPDHPDRPPLALEEAAIGRESGRAQTRDAPQSRVDGDLDDAELGRRRECEERCRSLEELLHAVSTEQCGPVIDDDGIRNTARTKESHISVAIRGGDSHGGQNSGATELDGAAVELCVRPVLIVGIEDHPARHQRAVGRYFVDGESLRRPEGMHEPKANQSERISSASRSARFVPRDPGVAAIDEAFEIAMFACIS